MADEMDLEPAHVEEVLQEGEDGDVEVTAHREVTEVLTTNQRAQQGEIHRQRHHLTTPTRQTRCSNGATRL